MSYGEAVAEAALDSFKGSGERASGTSEVWMEAIVEGRNGETQ